MQSTVITQEGHQLELENLLDPGLNKLYNVDLDRALAMLRNGQLNDINGEFALASFAKDERGRTVFVGARSIGVPARVACQLITPTHTRFIVAHTIREIREVWERHLAAGTGGVKPFDPTYTEMFPAFYRVVINHQAIRDKQHGWFLPNPEYGLYDSTEFFPPSVDLIGEAYIHAVRNVVQDQLRLIPDAEPIGLALSGGADSALVAAVLSDSLQSVTRQNPVILFTLAIDGGGSDLAQARSVADLLQRRYGRDRVPFHVISVRSSAVNAGRLMEEAAGVLEEHHVRDVECGMAGLLLYRSVQQKIAASEVPPIRFDFNGDGGNENFRDYPLVDEGYGIIELNNVHALPFLYLLGYHRTMRASSDTFSGGLSRAYTRTFNPARKFGVRTFSPLIDRRVIDVGRRIPLAALTPTPQQLHALRGEAVRAGVKQVIGLDLPVFPKARFQEGCAADPHFLRVTQEDQKRLKAMVIGTV